MLKNKLNKLPHHPYQIVDESPWPLIFSIILGITLLLFVCFNHQLMKHLNYWLIFSIIITIFTLFLWFKDIITESNYLGEHTKAVRKNIKIGFYLFLLSETFLFFSFFWAFFHSSLSPNIEIGAIWPPMGFENKVLNPLEIPLLNTIILLASGSTLTSAHYNFKLGNRSKVIRYLIATLFLSCLFLSGQYFEYSNASFTIADSVYGSTFYFLTGLHGLHIIIGTLFLFTSLIRIFKSQLTIQNHLGFELAIIYWHFCDIVWLFVFLFVYVWGY